MEQVVNTLPLKGSLKGVERPEMLFGVTFAINNVPIGDNMDNVYITINDLDGQAFEVFINARDSNIQEMLSISMVQISRMLRNDIALESIIEDLVVVHSANTSHMMKGGHCPSLAARIGYVLEEYLKSGGREGLANAQSNDEKQLKQAAASQ